MWVGKKRRMKWHLKCTEFKYANRGDQVTNKRMSNLSFTKILSSYCSHRRFEWYGIVKNPTYKSNDKLMNLYLMQDIPMCY